MLYHIRQSWMALRANLTAGLATLTTMTVTLTMLALVTLVALNLENIVRTIERDVQITAFLEATKTPDQAEALSEAVLMALQDKTRFPVLDSAKFVPKEEAYANLAIDFKSLADATSLVENPLSDRIVIKLTSPTNLVSTAADVRAIVGVKDVEYGSDFAQKVINAISSVRWFGIGLEVLLLLNSLFNILNTIRVAMYARRDEINVMRLIGATRGFIRLPYVLEGVGLGLLASLFTLIIVYPAYTSAVGQLRTLVPFLALIEDNLTVLQVLALITLLGVSLGLLGSLWATNRYLREVE
jgi:cell division transport system permease protein